MAVACSGPGLFERTLTTLLNREPGEERYTLALGAELPLARALEADLRAGDPVAAVVHALKLAQAFDTQLESPSVAAVIRAVLRGNAHAETLIRERILRPQGIDRARTFAAREGRNFAVRAPSFGGDADAPGVPLRTFLNPNFGARGETAHGWSRRNR